MVIVQKGDPKFAEMPRSQRSKSAVLYVNIGVYGYKASNFVVTITRGVDETFCSLGYKLAGVGSRQYNYYRFTSTEEDIQ